jgi:hypothetical protein
MHFLLNDNKAMGELIRMLEDPDHTCVAEWCASNRLAIFALRHFVRTYDDRFFMQGVILPEIVENWVKIKSCDYKDDVTSPCNNIHSIIFTSQLPFYFDLCKRYSSGVSLCSFFVVSLHLSLLNTTELHSTVTHNTTIAKSRFQELIASLEITCIDNAEWRSPHIRIIMVEELSIWAVLRGDGRTHKKPLLSIKGAKIETTKPTYG